MGIQQNQKSSQEDRSSLQDPSTLSSLRLLQFGLQSSPKDISGEIEVKHVHASWMKGRHQQAC